jgi:hypothetical protein
MSSQQVVLNEESAQLATMASNLSSPVVRQAHEMTIETHEDLEMAGSFKQMIATRRKALKAMFDWKNESTAHKIVIKTRAALTAAQAAWAAVVEPFDRGIQELADADRAIDPKIAAYLDRVERERKQLEAEASAAEKKRLDDAAVLEAQQLRDNGEPELADMVLQQAIEAPPPTVVLESTTPNTGSQFHKKTPYKFRVLKPELIPQEMLLPPDQHLLDPDWYPRIAAVVRAQGRMTKINGIEVYPDRKFVGQAAK